MYQSEKAAVVNAPFLQELKEGNVELYSNIHRLRQLRDETLNVETVLAEIGPRLQSLRDQLSRQFDLEETYGYVMQPPNIGSQVQLKTAQALQGHRWLYLALVELSEQVDDLEYRGTLRPNLPQILSELQAFLNSFGAHEALELDLIRSPSLIFQNVDYQNVDTEG